MTTYRPAISLKMVGIRIGDVLAMYDAPEQTCLVVQLEPPRVLYDGEVLSLSAAAGRVKGYDVSGPEWWTFEGVTLSYRRATFREWHER